jgi:hypothetical protein
VPQGASQGDFDVERQRGRIPRDGHRYGLALLLTVVLLVFVVAAPDGRLARSVSVLLAGALLGIIVASSGLSERARVGALVAVAVTVLGAILLALLGPERPLASRVVTAVLLGVMPVLVTRGVLQLVKTSGVGLRAVLGALTVYLLLGLVSALLYGIVAELERPPLFGADGRGTTSDYVYFSFTALTTTGFGNLAPATALGRAVTTFEMVIGQLYLVTVVAVLVGSLPGRARTVPRQGPSSS